VTFDSPEVFRVIVLGTLLIRSGFRLKILGIGSVVDNFLATCRLWLVSRNPEL